MSAQKRIAFAGFTPFERSSLESFFGRVEGPDPTHEVVHETWRADCIVANADDPQAVAHLQHTGMLERAVLLGTAVHEGAAVHLPRPINLALVRRAVDTLMGHRARASLARVPPPLPGPKAAPRVPPRAKTAPSEHTQRVLEELAYRTVPLPGDMDVRAMAASAAPLVARSSMPLPVEHVLMVSDGEEDFRALVLALNGFGFQAHLARSQEEAAVLLRERDFRYIFIDPQTAGTDALMLCRMARAAGSEDHIAIVVLLADARVAAPALERALPAADASLRRPLTREALLVWLGDREVERQAYVDTERSNTRM